MSLITINKSLSIQNLESSKIVWVEGTLLRRTGTMKSRWIWIIFKSGLIYGLQ